MSIWHESIDQHPGRCPVIRATGRDVVYELRVSGGIVTNGLFTPSPSVRLTLRCDDHDNVYVRIAHAARRTV